MLTLGIDPGTAICGFGLVELADANRLVAHHFGAITTSPKALMQDRLLKIHRELTHIIETYRPVAMGVEKLFFNRNVTTAIPVGQARGVVLLAAAQHNLELIELSPGEVKQSVTGYGKADKSQVIYMVTKLLRLPKPPAPDDVADALAVAIAALYTKGSLLYRNNLNS